MSAGSDGKEPTPSEDSAGPGARQSMLVAAHGDFLYARAHALLRSPAFGISKHFDFALLPFATVVHLRAFYALTTGFMRADTRSEANWRVVELLTTRELHLLLPFYSLAATKPCAVLISSGSCWQIVAVFAEQQQLEQSRDDCGALASRQAAARESESELIAVFHSCARIAHFACSLLLNRL